MFKVKKASTEIILIEELTDLLYELNEISNVHDNVHCKHDDFFRFNLDKAKLFAGHTIERISKFSSHPRQSQEMIESTSSVMDPEGYVDRGDLIYVLEKAISHADHIKLAYLTEVDPCTKAALKIIELYLQTAKYYIYGEDSIVK